ncbi:MAG TPA: hypothetical protein VFN53_06550 [Acidobacteriaceae bacterium]|nr:hypothetical protein [Acidobacteriaceae bacterium]
MKTAEEFYAFCKSKGACKEGLAAIAGMSFDEFWTTTKRGDWMLWLQGKLWHFTEELDADYQAKRAQLAADYRAERAQLAADYRAKIADLIRSIAPNPFQGQNQHGK